MGKVEMNRRGFLGFLAALGATGLIGSRAEKNLTSVDSPSNITGTKSTIYVEEAPITGAKLRGFRNGKWKDLGSLRSLEVYHDWDFIDVTHEGWGITGKFSETREFMKGLEHVEYDIEIEGEFVFDEYERFEAILSDDRKFDLGPATRSEVSCPAGGLVTTQIQFRAADVQRVG